jgi:ATP-dependent RNA helicase RhlE
MRFEDLRLIEPLLRAVRSSGYDTPTPIQATAIPHILDGKDVLGSAQTGTGKTAAFALPILQRLSETTGPRNGQRTKIRALVLAPTRELAQQIHDSFATYGRHLHLRGAVIYGGVGQGNQVRALRSGIDILVATPGRLLDLMGQGCLSLASIETLVLDEADRMLDMGFMPDVRRILSHVPAKRQTLMFSATMPPPIRKLADDILDKPVPVEVARVSAAAATVEQFVYHVEKPDKPMLLTSLLATTPHSRALIFTRTKHGADKLMKHLLRAGLRVAAIHGNKSQGARTRALAEFRSAKTPVLIATDIAARGLDVDDISHVFNYDLTADPETYVHRVGRTGRAGASGTAVSFCSSDERGSLRAIERLIRTPLQHAKDRPKVVHSVGPAVEDDSTPQDWVTPRPTDERRPVQHARRTESGNGPRSAEPRQGGRPTTPSRPGTPKNGSGHPNRGPRQPDGPARGRAEAPGRGRPARPAGPAPRRGGQPGKSPSRPGGRSA